MHCVFSSLVNGCSHRVLEDFEENVIQVGRKVDETQRILLTTVFDTNFPNLNSTKNTVKITMREQNLVFEHLPKPYVKISTKALACFSLEIISVLLQVAS
jgi:hypothetical protein